MMCRRSILAVVVVVLALVMSPTALANSSELAVVPPGRYLGPLSAAWWQTMLQIPKATNPTFDTTGGNCHFGETRKVFFLAGESTGNPVTRTCTVPSNKPLFFPIINVECSSVESAPFHGATPEARARCAKGFGDDIGVATLKVTLDGADVRHLDTFRAASPDFRFTMPSTDNILFVDGVTSGRSTSDGYWMLLKSPAPGTHTIHFEGAFVSGPGAGFSQNVTYNLTAECTHDGGDRCSNTG